MFDFTKRGIDMISLEKAKQLAQGYKLVPISREILSDVRTPIEVLRILKTVSSHCYMLESVEKQKKWGRYTFLGFDPKLEITCTDGVMTIKDGNDVKTLETKRPDKEIAKIMQEYTSPNIHRRTCGIFFVRLC